MVPARSRSSRERWAWSAKPAATATSTSANAVRFEGHRSSQAEDAGQILGPVTEEGQAAPVELTDANAEVVGHCRHRRPPGRQLETTDPIPGGSRRANRFASQASQCRLWPTGDLLREDPGLSVRPQGP